MAAKVQADRDDKVLMTFHVPRSVRDAATKKAKANSFNMSDYLEKCVRTFLQFPIENQTKSLQDIARDNMERASRFASVANRKSQANPIELEPIELDDDSPMDVHDSPMAADTRELET